MVTAIDPHPHEPEPGREARDLFDEIVATPVEAPRGRRRVILIPAAAALAVLGVIFIPQSAPAALAFQRAGDDWIVTVEDLYADPERFTEEFRARGFDIGLSIQPGSPSVVGQATGWESSAGSRIEAESMDSFRIPADFKGRTNIFLARPARPGERYSFAGDVNDEGELLHCVAFTNMTVDQVRAVLAERDGSIAEFRVGIDVGRSDPAKEVPGTWFVEDAVPSAPGEVLVWAAPDRTTRILYPESKMDGCPEE